MRRTTTALALFAATALGLAACTTKASESAASEGGAAAGGPAASESAAQDAAPTEEEIPSLDQQAADAEAGIDQENADEVFEQLQAEIESDS